MEVQALPHHYRIKAVGGPEHTLDVSAASVQDIAIAPPAQFGGPGDQWSPEDLFMASIASCFILSFRAIARASKLSWTSIECDSEGELDRLGGKTQFTKIFTTVSLLLEETGDIEKAERLLHKAEQTCLVLNSLTSESRLECRVGIATN
jgi:peroxiredoxin-like protein